MSEMTSAVQNALVADEQLISVVENLQYYTGLFVPHVSPIENYGCGRQAAMALTNRRIIAILWDNNVWKWISISALNSLVERPLSRFKSGWPYQAILMIPGGICLVVQTQTNDAEHAKQLSSLLVQGFMRFSTRRDFDDGTLAAIIAHEEELERQRQAAADDDRKKKE